MNLDTKELGIFAKKIVKEAGILLKNLKKQPLHLEEKKNHSDLVTFVDSAIEKFLVEKIQEKYPNHIIIGEEGIDKREFSDSKTKWIIDPIDGTTNFIHNFPYYGISVGIIHEEEGIIGVVYNPSTDELFYAEKDKGSYVNDERIKITNRISLKEALVSTTMFWDNYQTKENIHPSIIEIYKDTRGLRMVGGAAISLCEVAKGTLNAYIMPMLNTWDYTGGTIILRETGGIITQLNGKPVSFEQGGNLLATHPDIHQELLNILNKK